MFERKKRVVEILLGFVYKRGVRKYLLERKNHVYFWLLKRGTGFFFCGYFRKKLIRKRRLTTYTRAHRHIQTFEVFKGIAIKNPGISMDPDKYL